MSGPLSQRMFQIVGAGPAGLAAAITLARAGRRVVVHEAAGEVGSRFQGDHQGLENWTTEEDVLDAWRKMASPATSPRRLAERESLSMRGATATASAASFRFSIRSTAARAPAVSIPRCWRKQASWAWRFDSIAGSGRSKWPEYLRLVPGQRMPSPWGFTSRRPCAMVSGWCATTIWLPKATPIWW
ncbi:MAG: NAD(P)-binding protein [Betaproteobacteria bacterium]|nr:NAD(P)-binding protein [Betaproteobacteria bacterium]